MTRSGSLLLALVLTLPAACSAKKDGPGAQIVATSSGFCAEWAKRACNETVVAACAATDADACIAAQRDFCAGLVPDRKYSPPGAAACLDAVEAAFADGKLTTAERDTVRTLANECDKVLSGSVGEGGACDVDDDCNREADLECVKKANGQGTCQIPVEGTGGLDCSSPATVCVSGFYCDEGEHCVQAALLGQQCSASKPCGPDTQCLDADGGPLGATAADGGPATGTCEARAAVGSTCGTDDDCESRICSPGAGSSGGVCSAQILLSPSDPTCTELR